MSDRRPFVPQQPTCGDRNDKSVLGQKRKSPLLRCERFNRLTNATAGGVTLRKPRGCTSLRRLCALHLTRKINPEAASIRLRTFISATVRL